MTFNPIGNVFHQEGFEPGSLFVEGELPDGIGLEVGKGFFGFDRDQYENSNILPVVQGK